MFNLQYTLDVIEAAKSDSFFDDHNAMDIADIYGRCPEHVERDIIKKREEIKAVKEAKKSLSVLKNERDKLG